MSLTVYQLEYSPFCLSIIAALNACRVKYRVVNVPEQDRSVIIKLSHGRYYQVPFLLHGRKQICDDQHDTFHVARYLDRTFAHGRLFPADKEGLQLILLPHIENDVELTTFKLMVPHRTFAVRNVVERTMSLRFRERRFGRGCLQKWMKEAPALRRQAVQLLQPYELMVQHTPFLLGDAPVFADYALLGALDNMTWNGYEPFPRQLKALAAWRQRLRKWRFV